MNSFSCGVSTRENMATKLGLRWKRISKPLISRDTKKVYLKSIWHKELQKSWNNTFLKIALSRKKDRRQAFLPTLKLSQNLGPLFSTTSKCRSCKEMVKNLLIKFKIEEAQLSASSNPPIAGSPTQTCRRQRNVTGLGSLKESSRAAMASNRML